MTDVEADHVDVDSPWLVALGRRLQRAREAAGMMQETVQDRLGYPTRSLTRWENGGCEPGIEKVTRLADLYGVSVDWLAGRSDVRHCIRSGMVLIDDAALEQLDGLVAAGATVIDVPLHLVRRPGINYAAVVPDRLSIVSRDAAGAIETRMRELWQQLGGSS